MFRKATCLMFVKPELYHLSALLAPDRIIVLSESKPAVTQPHEWGLVVNGRDLVQKIKFSAPSNVHLSPCC